MPWHKEDVQDTLSHKGLRQQITTDTFVSSPLKATRSNLWKQHQGQCKWSSITHREDLANKGGPVQALVKASSPPGWPSLHMAEPTERGCCQVWVQEEMILLSPKARHYCVHLQVVLKSHVCFLAKQVLWILSCSNSQVTQLSHLPQTRMDWVLTHSTGLFSVWNATDKQPST